MANKAQIKELSYPIWFRVIFFCLTIVIPLILVMLEGFSATHKFFQITFGLVVSAIIFWLFIKHFYVNKLKTNLTKKQADLEYDYSTEKGNPEKIKLMWFTNEQKLTIFNAINVVLYGGLFCLIATGIASSVMKIRGAIIAIAICYVVAFVIKFLVILRLKGVEDDSSEQREQSDGDVESLQHEQHSEPSN